MRLLILPRYSPLGASSRLRTYQYLPLLRAAGFQVEISPLLGDDYLQALYAGRRSPAAVLRAYRGRWHALRQAARYDLVWVEKEALPWLPAGLELHLLRQGTALALDYDDAVFHRYDRHRNVLIRTLLGNKLDRLMRHARLVTAGNDYLAERARKAGCARVEWLPTVVDLERYPRRSRPGHRPGPVRVGWIGSPATAAYLQQVAAPLATLQAQGKIECVAIGARPDQLAGTPFRALPWSEQDEVQTLHTLDIGIMPLPDTPWEHGKCGYKLIQYMACTLPVVASPVGANRQIVTAGENGWLADTAQDWIQAITRLATDPELRHRMGALGRQRVEQCYSLQAQGERLISLLREQAQT